MAELLVPDTDSSDIVRQLQISRQGAGSKSGPTLNALWVVLFGHKNLSDFQLYYPNNEMMSYLLDKKWC